MTYFIVIILNNTSVHITETGWHTDATTQTEIYLRAVYFKLKQ